MSEAIIKVEKISKSYKIGETIHHDTLRDLLTDSFHGLLRKKEKKIHDNDDFVWALKDVSFELKRSEVVGIIGRNGAGKSTLLKILSRITEPTKGRVEICGRIGSLLEVGTGFHPELTGRENIYMNGAVLGMSKREIDRKLDEIIAFTEITKFIDTPVKRYSSGMYVRLTFAVAAYLETEILLVDEVLAVGDLAFQKKCLGKMEDVARLGRTVIFVSHNMGLVRYLCEKAIFLDNGRVEAIGSSGEIIGRYMKNILSDENVNNSGLIPAEKKRVKTESASVISAAIEALDKKSSRQFDIWEPFKIVIEIESFQSDLTIIPWVFIYNSFGDTVLTSFYYDNAEKIKGNQGSNIKCALIIDPNFLMPGRYTVSVGIFGPLKVIYDWSEHILSFEIGNSFLSGRQFDGRPGVASFPYKWEVV
ncbi:MAG: ABC transporter ATP-binding protein [Candidatus Omnitrophica bacterium]|nr:ABC transporter ATP-binding protein [Candidatus Omnitrophota bacterium]